MTLKQQAAHIITALPADKLSQVVNFAKFLLAQPETDWMPEPVQMKEGKCIRRSGILKGQINIADDFNETPDCFREYM